MALLKKIGQAIPVNPTAILKAIGHAEEESMLEYHLTILIDSSLDLTLAAYTKEAFKPRSSNLALSVIPYFEEPPIFAHDTAAVVVFAAEARATGRVLSLALEAGLPAVVLTLDPALLLRIARNNHCEIDPHSIITAPLLEESSAQDERYAELFRALGAWIVRKLPGERLGLARALDFVRDPFVKDATQGIALQNAAVAAVFFLPGTDMPVLTLNQMRLFLQIASAYNAELDIQRLKELAVVLLGGFGFRGIARRLVGLVPVLGWAVRGAVGYTGTLAVGKVAQEYFKVVR